MRKFFFTALFVLALCACAFADASLYRGTSRVGVVQTIENNLVPVDDVGKLLGFTASRSGEELTLTRGSVTLRVIANSAAAWQGFSIVPLHSSPVDKNGKLWVDAQSAVALFQNTAGTGTANRLRFTNSASARLTASDKPTEGAGMFPEPTPPKITTAAKPTAPQATQTPQTVPETPKDTPTQQEVDATIQAMIDNLSSKPQEPKTEGIVFADTPATRTPKTASAPKQPKYESFKPTDSRTDNTESYSGTIQALRWTTQEGTHKKIRATVEVNGGAEPEVFMSEGKLHALFSEVSGKADIASPYANVKAELIRNTKGVELVFTPEKFTRADKTVIRNKIVFDFFFPESVKITAARPTTPAVTPTAQQKPAPTQQTTRTDPIITTTPRRRSPAVTTPPSTITIPTSAAAASRLNTRRRTVVVDPGHGGKDPGASANGVVEKNVNLAVGLALHRVLTERGYNVIMTRNTDVYLTLQERTDVANNANADIFVSIHVNALPSRTTTTGFEIYIMALPTDKDAMNLAKIENREYVEGKGVDTANVDRRTEMLLRILGDMQQNNKISESTDFAAALYNAGVISGLPMKRVAQAPFFVLRGAGMPAVLLETGFVTNVTESRRLATPEYQTQIAQAMAAGIVNYLK